MKQKWMALLVAMMLAATALTPAFAESTLARSCTALINLLQYTDNVTIDAGAVFSLNGARFKTVKLHYVQDGENSYHQLDLFSPSATEDEADKQSGYTIIANGDQVYEMDAFCGIGEPAYSSKLYSACYTSPKNSVLRRNLMLAQVLNLAANTAGILEASLGDRLLITDGETGGTTLQLNLTEEDGIGLVNTALNLLMQYGFQHYYYVNSAYVSPVGYEGCFNDFLTPASSILYSTRSIALKAADVTIEEDASGNLTGVQGNVTLKLTARDNSTHEVAIGLDVKISDYGTSKVKTFDPEEYGVTPYENSYYFCEPQNGLDAEMAADLGDNSLRIWEKAGFSANDLVDGYSYSDGDCIRSNFYDSSNAAYTQMTVTYDKDGSVIAIQRFDAPWLISADIKESDLLQDEAKMKELTEVLMALTETMNPGMSQRFNGFDVANECQSGDERFVLLDDFEGDLHFVVRLEPTLRVEYFSCRSVG